LLQLQNPKFFENYFSAFRRSTPQGTTISQQPLARAILTKDQLGILQKLSKDESITTDTTNKIYYEGFKQDILGLRVEASLRI
jgi:hypothetical protein